MSDAEPFYALCSYCDQNGPASLTEHDQYICHACAEIIEKNAEIKQLRARVAELEKEIENWRATTEKYLTARIDDNANLLLLKHRVAALEAAARGLREVMQSWEWNSLSGETQDAAAKLWAALKNQAPDFNPAGEVKADHIPDAGKMTFRSIKQVREHYYPNSDSERTWACSKCGALRTKAEGGNIFSMCEECWERNVSTPSTDAPGRVERPRELGRVDETQMTYDYQHATCPDTSDTEPRSACCGAPWESAEWGIYCTDCRKRCELSTPAAPSDGG
jgi:hypothetical protein